MRRTGAIGPGAVDAWAMAKPVMRDSSKEFYNVRCYTYLIAYRTIPQACYLLRVKAIFNNIMHTKVLSVENKLCVTPATYKYCIRLHFSVYVYSMISISYVCSTLPTLVHHCFQQHVEVSGESSGLLSGRGTTET